MLRSQSHKNEWDNLKQDADLNTQRRYTQKQTCEGILRRPTTDKLPIVYTIDVLPTIIGNRFCGGKVDFNYKSPAAFSVATCS